MLAFVEKSNVTLPMIFGLCLVGKSFVIDYKSPFASELTLASRNKVDMYPVLRIIIKII
jgi:hypothetical protein